MLFASMPSKVVIGLQADKAARRARRPSILTSPNSCSLRNYQGVKQRVPLTKGLANRGFTLLEIMIVILVIPILVAIAVPNYMQSRAKSRRTVCLENLRLIDSAKEQAAMAKSLKEGDSLQWTDVVPTYIKGSPSCPTGGAYSLNAVGTDPTCSLAQIGHHQ